LGDAALGGITRLWPGTKEIVVTETVVGQVKNLVLRLIATVYCTRDSVIDPRQRRAYTTVLQITRLRPRTIEAIIADRILWEIQDTITAFITRVGRASDPVVGDRRDAGLASRRGVAHLLTIAKETVRTDGIVRHMLDDAFHLAAGVDGATDAVIDDRRHTGLAIVNRMADLGTIAVETIIASAVIDGVRDVVCLLVASVDGASDAITRHGRNPGLATIDRVADLGTITKLTVTAACVVRRVHHHAE
jgi:hypothetical protein